MQSLSKRTFKSQKEAQTQNQTKSSKKKAKEVRDPSNIYSQDLLGEDSGSEQDEASGEEEEIAGSQAVRSMTSEERDLDLNDEDDISMPASPPDNLKRKKAIDKSQEHPGGKRVKAATQKVP